MKLPIFVYPSTVPLRRTALCVAVAAQAMIPHVLASQSQTAQSLTSPSATETLDPVTVTASRGPETVNESLAAVTVITRKDIVHSGARTIQDLLAGTAGISMTNAGGMGKQSNIHLRGSESDHLLVLVDGVRLNSATAGMTAFQFLPLSQVERVEVVRGPRSSLYGAEAVGGVIQIFTRREGAALRSELQVGSNSTSQLSQSFAFANEQTRANLTASLLDTQGISAQKDSQPDRDGYDNQSLTAAVDHQWNDQWRSGASLFRAQGQNDYDNRFDPLDTVLLDEFVQQVISGHIGFTPSDELDIRLQLAESRDESQNYKNGQPDGLFVTERYSALLQGDYQVSPAHRLTLGLDYTDEQIEATTQYDEDSRYNLGTFAQWQAQQGPMDWQFSARYDDNEAVGSQTTWNAATGFYFSPALKVYVAYGTAFKAPTFNELYYPDLGFYRGNPNLEVEESKSWEAGVKGQLENARWALAYFQNDVENLITFDSAAGTSINVGEAEMRGVEAELAMAWQGWRSNLAVTYVEAKDATTQSRLARRPTWSGRLGLGYDWERYQANLSMRAQDDSFDDARNTRKLGGFAVLDAGFTWLPVAHWSLKAEVLNFLDKDYEQLQGFNTYGRTYWLTLAYEH